MKKTRAISRALLLFLLVAALVFAASCGSCEHRDANDDNKCDYCSERFMDGKEPCTEHRDADDNDKCDKCGASFTDGKDVADPCEHVDADDNGKCDKCDEDFTDGCDATHIDANDDGKCDFGGEAFTDGCDATHIDANDDGKCDFGGEAFTDGCDTVDCLDTDEDGKCDNEGCDKATENKPAPAKITLTVTVKDNNGNPVTGIKVQICKEGENCQKPVLVDENGAVSFSVEAGTYYASFPTIPEGYTETDEDGKYYFGDNTSITVVLTAQAPAPTPCEHVDANDDGKCDECDEVFSDGCDTKECLDTDNDGKCNNAGCNKATENKPKPVCNHVDINDDLKCDECGESYDDGEEESFTIIKNGKTDYTLVYGKSNSTVTPSSAAYSISNLLYSEAGIDINHKKYVASMGTEMLILFGIADGIDISAKLAADVDSRPTDSYAYGIAYKDGVLALYANSKAACDRPPITKFDNTPFFDDLLTALGNLFVDGNLTLKNGFYHVFELTNNEYIKLVANDEVKYAEKLQQIREERVDFLIEALENFNTTDFGTPETGSTFTKKFSVTSNAPTAYPTKSQHPRILFTAEDIPAIRANLEAKMGSSDYKRFMAYIEGEDFLDGILGEVTEQEKGYYNWDGEVLNKIQANALAYLIFDDEFYGYTAIYAMKNFLLTLKIDHITGDQSREFGKTMYIAACVYDWCHDLLSEEDKLQIATGVEHRICRGKNPAELGGTGSNKMEMGFPPAGQNGVVGHGSEFQLLRDYLSFSVAIYDEYPGWYEFIGGRFYSEYVPVRNVYYSAGHYPQGTGTYGPWRFVADCFAAAIITSATGENPYTVDMAQVVFSFASYEVGKGSMFVTGDGPTHSAELPVRKLGYHAIILSHLFYDTEEGALLRLMAESFISDYLETWICNVSNPEYFIFSSREVAQCDSNKWRELLPNISYNGDYMGQYIVRNRWDENGTVVLMKIGEMTTANHDHQDAGTFQIYYKGLLSGATGDYDSYNSEHWKYYHQETVSKNGMLIFDPSQVSSNKWYSGGQSANGREPTDLNQWLSGSYDRAEVTAHSSAYAEDGITPLYAYIAGDLTKAYYSSQASYVGRSMLTVYTDNEDVPMILFVFDRVDAKKTNFIKKFLLQVNGTNAPTVDSENKTVTVTENGGRLVLQNIVGCDEIVALGGGDGYNYLINGENCIGDSVTPTYAWGRVELHKSGNLSDTMLNVLYVTDSSSETLLKTVSVSAYSITGAKKLLEGAVAGNVAAFFATETSLISEGFEFTVEADSDMTYYVGGLADGEWNVYVNGELLCTKELSNNEGLITFTAPAGTNVSVEPVT